MFRKWRWALPQAIVLVMVWPQVCGAAVSVAIPRVTQAPKIEKSEGEIRWKDSTASIYNRFRAFDPRPGVFIGNLRLIDLRPAKRSGKPGTILSIDDGVTVATGDGAIKLLTLQRAGRARMPAAEFARGAGWRVGAQIS